MQAELNRVWSEIKGHPYIAAGAFFVIGAVLIMVLRSRSAAPVAAAAQTTGADPALASYEAQQAQLAAAQSQQQSALAGVQSQVNGAIQVATIGAANTALAIGTSGSIQLANIAANETLGLTSFADQLALGIAGIGAQSSATALQAGYLNNVVNDQYQSVNQQTAANETLQSKLLDIEQQAIASRQTVVAAAPIAAAPPPVATTPTVVLPPGYGVFDIGGTNVYENAASYLQAAGFENNQGQLSGSGGN